jgi:nicotine oxidoreductase
LEGDIKKYFDTINHHKLIEILNEEIKDKEFIDFIWKAIKAEYVSVLEKKIEYSEINKSQGYTLSSMLSNIYLHKLDKFMEQLVEKSKKTGPTSINNTKYKKIHTTISNNKQISQKIYRYNKYYKLKIQDKTSMFLNLKEKKSVLKSKIINKVSYRIYYVRYADDFLIGVDGTKSKANEIKEQVKIFIKEELLLELNIEKTKIISAIKSRVLFLGSHIRISKSSTYDQKRRINSYMNNGRKIRAKNPIRCILMLAPIEKITKKLAEEGICKIKNFSKREVIPCRKTAWLNLESHNIINKYNKIWKGILNYYSFAYNRCQLNFIQYLIQHSAACTLMSKLKISSRAKIFKKFGFTLTINIPNSKKSISLDIQKNLKRINKYNIKVNLPYDKFNHNLKITNNDLLLKPCAICKSINDVKMYLKKYLINKKTNNILKGIKVNLSKKQIFLCKDCRRNVYNSTYDDPGIY